MRFALAPKEVGAHGTSAGEMGANIIGPRLHRKWAHPYDCKMTGAVTAPYFPMPLLICGDSTSGPRRNTACTTLMARCRGDDLPVDAEESLSG